MAYSGFEPIFDKNSKVLILGSFPSVKSRENQFYYGNRLNRFWRTMQSVFGGEIDTVGQKTQLCLKNGVALWDIVASCDVEGSLDGNLRNCVLVDLSVVLDSADIELILCNGKTSYNFTSRAYKGGIPVVALPSTSPANTRFNEELWRKYLRPYAKGENK